MTENEEKRCITSGIFYCRDSAEINGSGSLQTSSWFDSDVLRNRQQKHTAVRYVPFKMQPKVVQIFKQKIVTLQK